jgi:hypothetical protein
MHFLSNEYKEQWIENYVQRDTAGARKRVEDAEAAIQQKQEDMSNVEIEELTTREPERTFHNMLNVIGDSLRDLASFDDKEDVEAAEGDNRTVQGMLIDDDEAVWVMGTMLHTARCCMERFWQMQTMHGILSPPGLRDMADYFRNRDKKYTMPAERNPAGIESSTDHIAAAPPPRTCGELIATLDMVS